MALKDSKPLKSQPLDDTFQEVIQCIYGPGNTKVGELQQKVNAHIDYRIKKYLEKTNNK